jgi:DNA-binding response OmpR family regulator
MPATILVAEDQTDIRELIAMNLRNAGYEVSTVGDGPAALASQNEQASDLLILDLMMPGLDGLEVCKALRARGRSTPILMLTAKSTELDRVLGLELGADDYLTKPFSPRELAARVAALMRRPRRLGVPDGRPDTGLHRVGDLVVDPRRHTAEIDGRELTLTRTEFGLLVALVREPDRVWTRQELLVEVWGTDWTADGHLVEVHLGNLRRKLGDDASRGRFVRTVRGVGYRLGAG